MKNILFLLFIASALLSCQKEEQQTTTAVEQPSTPSLPEMLVGDEYVGNRVKTLMLGLLNVSHDNTFVDLVNTERPMEIHQPLQ